MKNRNEITFSDIPYDHQDAFTLPVETIGLEHGELLFRFTMSPLPSPWWFDFKYLKDILRAAQQKNENLPTYIRKRSAVYKKWNSMNYLMVVRLNNKVMKDGKKEFDKEVRPVFIGGVASQQFGNRTHTKKSMPLRNEHKTKYYTKPIFLGGGFEQIYIYGAKESDYSLVIPVGTVFITDPIEEILDFLDRYHYLIR